MLKPKYLVASSLLLVCVLFSSRVQGGFETCTAEVNEYSGETYYYCCLGYENYDSASDPYTPTFSSYWYDYLYDSPNPDDVMNTDVFGKDIMVQLSEDAVENLAKAYFFENISEFSFSESTTLSGTPITMEGNLINLRLSITSDNQVEIEVDAIVQVSSSTNVGVITLTGTTVLTGNVALETASGGDPEAIVIDSAAISSSTANVSGNGMIVSLNVSSVETEVNNQLATIVSGLRIPLAGTLGYFSNFVNPVYGMTYSDLGVKIVHVTLRTGDDPFVMVGMNIYSGAASSVENTVFDEYHHNKITDDGIETASGEWFEERYGDNDETNMLVAITPRALDELVINYFAAYFPYTSDDGTVTITDYTLATDSQYWLDDFYGYDCMNAVGCDEEADSCALNPLSNGLNLDGSGTYDGRGFSFESRLFFSVANVDGYYYLHIDPLVTYVDVDTSWWEDLFIGVVEFFTLGHVDLITVMAGGDLMELAGEEFEKVAEQAALLLNYTSSDNSVSGYFHTLRASEYTTYSYMSQALDFGDIEFAGKLEMPKLDTYTADSDGDGLVDIVETNVLGTNPNLADSDGDGLTDYDEIYLYASDANLSDSDSDGIDDNREVNFYGTSPVVDDTDQDSVRDNDEVENGMDPLDETDAGEDWDMDGLTNAQEINTYGTDIRDDDTENDGLIDGDEVNVYGSDPLIADTDADGLSDGDEVHTYGSDPVKSDTDGEGLMDGEEVLTYGTDPTKSDTDGDVWTDYQEVHTNFTKAPLVYDNLVATFNSHDVDGDGKDDLVAFLPSGKFSVVTSGGSSLTYRGSWVTGIGDETSIPLVGDFSGDGKDDVAAMNPTSGSIVVATSSGSAFTSSGSWISGFGTNSTKQLVGDFNGDGKDDVVAQDTSGNWTVATSTGSAFTSRSTWLTSEFADTTVIYAGDFDGDSQDDLLAFYSDTGTIEVALSNGSSFDAPAIWLVSFDNGSTQHFVGDFDGNNEEDFIAYQGDGTFEVATSLGDSFQDLGTRGNLFPTNSNQIATGDLTGDSKMDVVGYSTTASSPDWETSTWTVFYSNGSYLVSGGVWTCSISTTAPSFGGGVFPGFFHPFHAGKINKIDLLGRIKTSKVGK